MNTKTWVPKGQDLDGNDRKWYIIDATDVALGRLCTRVANLLTGKTKPTYTPHADMGDNVIIINASKVQMTGNKFSDKMYHRHSGYPGGVKELTAGEKLEKKPDSFIKDAVKGMLPHTKLGRKMLKKLRVYAGAEHEHAAQNPEEVAVADLR